MFNKGLIVKQFEPSTGCSASVSLCISSRILDIARILTCLLGLKKHCEQFRIYQDFGGPVHWRKKTGPTTPTSSGENDIKCVILNFEHHTGRPDFINCCARACGSKRSKSRSKILNVCPREEKGEIRSFSWWAKCLSGANINMPPNVPNFEFRISSKKKHGRMIHISPTSIYLVIRAFWEVKCAAFVESRDNPFKNSGQEREKTVSQRHPPKGREI